MFRISVVVPTYNRAGLIVRTLRSIVSQTRPPDEIFVIDDGSTDNTADIVARFAPGVTYISQANGGAAAARNRGVGAASGDFVAFLDSDDVWARDFLARIVQAIDATQGNAATYFADLAYTGGEKTAWELSGLAIDGDFEFREDPLDWFLMPLQPMTTQVTVVRRDAYQVLGGQDASIVCRQDTHLFLRLGFFGPACAVAGVGGELTPDAQDARLTAIHHPQTIKYWHDTVRMYGDVIRSCDRISPSHRRDLARRLADAHWRLSRLEWGERRIGSSLANVARSLRCSPSVVTRTLARRLRAAATLF